MRASSSVAKILLCGNRMILSPAFLLNRIVTNNDEAVTTAMEAGMTLNDFADTPSSGTEASHETKKRFTETEKQLIEKIRCLRADKKKALYVFFGIREDK